MNVLLLDAAAVLAAPLVDRLVTRTPAASVALHDMARVAVLGIVFLHVLPHGVFLAGWSALVAFLVGLGVVWIAERPWSRIAEGGALWAIIAALSLHHVLDGVALALPSDEPVSVLAIGVLAHTLPVSLIAWRFALAHGGRSAGRITLAVILASTAIGWLAAINLPESPSGPPLGWVSCFLGGALVHVVGHRMDAPPDPADAARHRFASGVGACVGALVAWAVAADHPIPRRYLTELTIGQTFQELLVESAPAILLGFVFAGLFRLVDADRVDAILGRGGPLGRSVRGALLGVPLPICTCSALPMYEGLVKRGVPRDAATAFLVGAPEIGISSALLSFPMLGAPLASLRIALASAIAVVAGLTFSEPQEHRPEAPPPAPAPSAAPVRALDRARDGLQYALTELVDHNLPWIFVGIATAALMEPLLDPEWLSGIPSSWAVPMMALIGLPAYVCASGSTPLAAVLLHKGVSVGAVFALLLTGPATNVSTFAVLTRLHGRAHALRFGATLMAFAVATGWLIDAFLPTFPLPVLTHGAEHTASAWGVVSAVAVVGLGVAMMVRIGLDGFLDQLGLLQLLGHAEHANHGHDEACACHAGTSAPDLTPPSAALHPHVVSRSAIPVGGFTLRLDAAPPKRDPPA
jgi:uncharacterized membrane protein YraQ (UPF0718 family)